MREHRTKFQRNNQFDDVRLPVSIRAYTPAYSAAMLLSIFFGLLSVYFGFRIISIVLFVAAFGAIPILRLTDRIVFDGRRLVRTGLIPRLWFRAGGLRTAIKLRNVEQVDTVTLGTFRRAGKVRSQHRTSVFGDAPAIVFSGSGKRYRQMLRALLPALDAQILDSKSFELQKYCVEPYQAIQAANELKIPASDVLSESITRRSRSRRDHSISGEKNDAAFAVRLRTTANELSVSGSLVRAIEAFRRALILDRNNGWLLYEFSRTCSSLALVERSEDLQHRAAAALRLAERRANGDAELLERIGESYRRFGYLKRAASAYQSALERLDNCFRALIGLAEVAIDEGKLAHVVHNFIAANRAIDSRALQKWTSSEANYFSHLTEDDKYMELEISRLNLLEKLERWRRSLFRVALYSIPLIAAGVILEESLVAEAGWLASGICFLLWAGTSVMMKMLSPRIPFEILESGK